MIKNARFTPGSRSLFVALAKDACNWGGTPGLDLNVSTDAASRGHVTHLKKLGLITTSKSDGETWVHFTDFGGDVASGMNIDLGEYNPTSEGQKALRAEWEASKIRVAETPAVELSAPVAAVKIAAHIGRERASGRYYLVVAGSFRKIMSGFETPEAAAQWTEGTEYVVVSGPKSVR